MKFYNRSIHRSKVQISPKNRKSMKSFHQNFMISNVNQIIYSSAPASILNTKALAQFFRYFAHNFLKFCLQRDTTQNVT